MEFTAQLEALREAENHQKTLALFDGVTFDPAQDAERLTSQLERVRNLMLDGRWRTLRQIAYRIGGSEAGVSARLRDLRKARFGGFTVNRSYVGSGLWIYQVLAPRQTGQAEMFGGKQ